MIRVRSELRRDGGVRAKVRQVYVLCEVADRQAQASAEDGVSGHGDYDEAGRNRDVENLRCCPVRLGGKQRRHCVGLV